MNALKKSFRQEKPFSYFSYWWQFNGEWFAAGDTQMERWYWA